MLRSGRRVGCTRRRLRSVNRRTNKSALCAHVAAQAGVSRATADVVVSTAVSAIAEARARNETVPIAAFGTISTRARTAETMTTSSRYRG